MFDRFTERARKVMTLARIEAQGLRNDYIGTEHILLGLAIPGLAMEESGVAAQVLENLGLDMGRVRAETLRLTEREEYPARSHQLPFTPRAKRVLENALREAQDLGHNYIGTEHLLLGLLGETDGPAAHVLRNLGVEREAVRAGVIGLLGVEPPGARTGGGASDEGFEAEHEAAEALSIEVAAMARDRFPGRTIEADLNCIAIRGRARYELALSWSPGASHGAAVILLGASRLESLKQQVPAVLEMLESMIAAEEGGTRT